MTSLRIANEQMGMDYRDVWTTAYVNDLPDSSFLYIAPGGTKTNGKTDGAHRYFPVKDASGKPDAAHINNAIARINQANIPDSAKTAAMTKAKAMAAAHPDIGSGKTSQYEGSAGSGRSRVVDSGLQLRSFAMTLEVRSDGDGRTLVGRAVPYGEVATIGAGQRERFMLGAFSRQIQAGPGAIGNIRLYDTHDPRLAGAHSIGNTVRLAERSDGCYGEWRVKDTRAGDDALREIRSGTMGLSIGFKNVPNGTVHASDGVLERHAVHLDHVALTEDPVYEGAAITAVRSIDPRQVSGFRTAQERQHALLERIRIAP